MDRAALAGFLRRRREALRPGDVGLPAAPRRRAPGLRREEIAALAAMSVDYYTRLEQQRGPQPSEQMLASLAQAVRLTGDERDYLFRIAGPNPPASTRAATHVAPALLVLTAPPRTEGYEKLQLLAVLGQQRFAEAGPVS